MFSHNWMQFLALYCSYRNYRTSSKVCLEIQCSIIFSKFEKCWYCLYLIYKWIFFFFFFSFFLQSNFPLSKISHFPIFMTLSPLGLLAILKIFLYSSSYAYFWQLLPPLTQGADSDKISEIRLFGKSRILAVFYSWSQFCTLWQKSNNTEYPWQGRKEKFLNSKLFIPIIN